MLDTTFGKILMSIIILATIGIILFNPLTGVIATIEVIALSKEISGILGSVGYRGAINPFQVEGAILLAEYAFLGIMLMIASAAYYRDLVARISMPLFVGLLIAVGSAYFRSVSGEMFSGLDDVIYTFLAVIVGMLIYFAVKLLFFRSKTSTSTYRKSKYKRRK